MEKFDDKYEGKNPFYVPEGYFDGLEDQVFNRLQKQKRLEKIKWTSLLMPYVGLVAVFMLAFFVVQVILPRFVDENRMVKGRVEDTQEQLEDVVESGGMFHPSSEDIYEYLSTELVDYELVYAELYKEE